MTAPTWVAGHGWTFRSSSFGGRTDRALHGLRAISPSSTAALKTAETLMRTTRT
jgi:hypothetical protein